MITPCLFRESQHPMPHQMNPRVTVVALLACLLLVGCKTDPSQTGLSSTERPKKSRLLVRTASVVLAQALIARKQAGGQVPDDYQSTDFVVSVLESIRLQHPEVFMVTDSEEERFARGKFDSSQNEQTVADALERLTDQNIPLTTMNAYLADEFVEDRLSGLRLELAARLLKAQLKTAMVSDVQSSL